MLSATLSTQLRSLEMAIEAMKQNDGSKVLVGGLAFAGASELWQKLGADGYAANAEEALETCLKGDSQHPEAHKWLGFIYKDSKRKELAIKAFERHLRQNPKDLDVDLVKDTLASLKRNQ